jgi:hypothetical protein
VKDDGFTLEDLRAAVAVLRKNNRPKPYGQLWWSLAPELERALVEAEAAGETLDAACARLRMLRVSPAQFTALQDAGTWLDEEDYLGVLRHILGDAVVQEALDCQREGRPAPQYTIVVDGART